MAAKKKLATYVHVDGVAYGPDDDLPAEVAEKITNPAAWAQGGDSEAQVASEPQADASLPPGIPPTDVPEEQPARRARRA